MNMDRIKYRYWEHAVWDDPKSPLVARYTDIVTGCDPTVAVSDFEFCTGLKDRNGNLIYEGDIVRCDRDYSKDGRVSLIRKVVYSDGAFQLKTLADNDLYYINAFHNFEIIGNIHEQKDAK